MSQNQSFLSSPEAAALLKNKAALKTLLSSPESRQLMSALQKRSGGQLQKAAKQAQQGNISALSAMVKELAATGEGERLIAQLERSIKR